MSCDTMPISATLRDGVLVIEVLIPQLNDFDRAHELRDEVLAIINAMPPVRVVLDLQHVELLTSVALFPFIEIRQAVEKRGKPIVVCNVSTPVARALTVSQLLVESRSTTHHLVLTEDMPAAINWLQTCTMAY